MKIKSCKAWASVKPDGTIIYSDYESEEGAWKGCSIDSFGLGLSDRAKENALKSVKLLGYTIIEVSVTPLLK